MGGFGSVVHSRQYSPRMLWKRSFNIDSNKCCDFPFYSWGIFIHPRWWSPDFSKNSVKTVSFFIHISWIYFPHYASGIFPDSVWKISSYHPGGDCFPWGVNPTHQHIRYPCGPVVSLQEWGGNEAILPLGGPQWTEFWGTQWRCQGRNVFFSEVLRFFHEEVRTGEIFGNFWMPFLSEKEKTILCVFSLLVYMLVWRRIGLDFQ